jgi:hypothetical protein
LNDDLGAHRCRAAGTISGNHVALASTLLGPERERGKPLSHGVSCVLTGICSGGAKTGSVLDAADSIGTEAVRGICSGFRDEARCLDERVFSHPTSPGPVRGAGTAGGSGDRKSFTSSTGQVTGASTSVRNMLVDCRNSSPGSLLFSWIPEGAADAVERLPSCVKVGDGDD